MTPRDALARRYEPDDDEKLVIQRTYAPDDGRIRQLLRLLLRDPGDLQSSDSIHVSRDGRDSDGRESPGDRPSAA